MGEKPEMKVVIYMGATGVNGRIILMIKDVGGGLDLNGSVAGSCE
jgi:Ni,Fe-hydrogenase III small subunit